MPPLHVETPRTKVRTQGGRIVIERSGEVLARIALNEIDEVSLSAGVEVTGDALRRLLRSKIAVSWTTRNGVCLGRLGPVGEARWRRIVAQHALWSDPARRVVAARSLMTELHEATVGLVAAHRANHPSAELKQLHARLREFEPRIETALSIDTLRGVEGRMAAIYWQAFSCMLRGEFDFEQRTRRPPQCAVSALLSYGYALLANEVTGRIAASGYDPALGFYHVLRPGRPALALDLMEPWRRRIIDRLVLRSVNLRNYGAEDFRRAPAGSGVWLTTEAAHRYRQLYDQFMTRTKGCKSCLRERISRRIQTDLRRLYKEPNEHKEEPTLEPLSESLLHDAPQTTRADRLRHTVLETASSTGQDCLRSD
ncbi:CRISPR-associated endonuclease Cas1 [Botrimarina hoheduenensis]|uniref:CRISPR-associated endonuclease Cas1 n=1 Tax=Botrimarina hoheduenensis TaxID=2528000 RepID=A0A5C5VQ31_9BACT|nr:CRISPR-associated endonuclease Cas1 [Botrimarina hoheduenensis]TWT40045.1 CRISPR-associated endonuclease Cas1 [Botrimarina hoheduenensis]